MGAFILFLVGIAAFVVAWLKKVAGQTAALDAAEKKADEAAAAVEEKTEAVAQAEDAAVEVRESVSERLAKLEEDTAAEKARDSVDVANDIIGRN